MFAELLDAVKGSPLLLAVVVVGGLVVFAVERLGGLNGPLTRAVTAWRDRELRRLRREAMLRAEQRRIEADERSDRERELLRELAQARWERDDARRQLDRAQRRAQATRPTEPLPWPRASVDDETPTTPLRRESARGRHAPR